MQKQYVCHCSAPRWNVHTHSDYDPFCQEELTCSCVLACASAVCYDLLKVEVPLQRLASTLLKTSRSPIPDLVQCLLFLLVEKDIPSNSYDNCEIMAGAVA